MDVIGAMRILRIFCSNFRREVGAKAVSDSLGIESHLPEYLELPTFSRIFYPNFMKCKKVNLKNFNPKVVTDSLNLR